MLQMAKDSRAMFLQICLIAGCIEDRKQVIGDQQEQVIAIVAENVTDV